MRCAPVCEVDCDRSTERSTGVSVRLSEICLWRFLWMAETCFFCVIFRRRAAPDGFNCKTGLFICSESVVWSCALWALSRGAALKRVSCVSGDWVVAINVGIHKITETHTHTRTVTGTHTDTNTQTRRHTETQTHTQRHTQTHTDT